MNGTVPGGSEMMEKFIFFGILQLCKQQEERKVLKDTIHSTCLWFLLARLLYGPEKQRPTLTQCEDYLALTQVIYINITAVTTVLQLDIKAFFPLTHTATLCLKKAGCWGLLESPGFRFI